MMGETPQTYNIPRLDTVIEKMYSTKEEIARFRDNLRRILDDMRCDAGITVSDQPVAISLPNVKVRVRSTDSVSDIIQTVVPEIFRSKIECVVSEPTSSQEFRDGLRILTEAEAGTILRRIEDEINRSRAVDRERHAIEIKGVRTVERAALLPDGRHLEDAIVSLAREHGFDMCFYYADHYYFPDQDIQYSKNPNIAFVQRALNHSCTPLPPELFRCIRNGDTTLEELPPEAVHPRELTNLKPGDLVIIRVHFNPGSFGRGVAPELSINTTITAVQENEILAEYYEGGRCQVRIVNSVENSLSKPDGHKINMLIAEKQKGDGRWEVVGERYATGYLGAPSIYKYSFIKVKVE